MFTSMKFCTPHIWLMKRGIFPILSRCYVWQIDLEKGIYIREALCHCEIFRYIIQVLDINFSGWLKYHSYLLKYFPYLYLSYNARKRSFTLTKNKIILSMLTSMKILYIPKMNTEKKGVSYNFSTLIYTEFVLKISLNFEEALCHVNFFRYVIGIIVKKISLLMLKNNRATDSFSTHLHTL